MLAVHLQQNNLSIRSIEKQPLGFWIAQRLLDLFIPSDGAFAAVVNARR